MSALGDLLGKGQRIAAPRTWPRVVVDEYVGAALRRKVARLMIDD